MSINLSFSIEGEKQLSRVIKGLQTKDLRQPFDEAGKELVVFYKTKVFDSQGGVIGEKWKGGPQYHGLVRTGTMRRRFQHRATRSRLEISNPTEYFKYHQSNRARKTNLPRRVMLKLDEPRKRLIVKTVQKSYVNTLKGR